MVNSYLGFPTTVTVHLVQYLSTMVAVNLIVLDNVYPKTLDENLKY